MGTNFYKVIPVSKRTKDILKEKIDKEDFHIDRYGDIVFDNMLQYDFTPNVIHIGKRSGGWKFLFDCNDWKYFCKNEKSLIDWIKDNSDGSFIKDEYGEIYDADTFLKEVDITYNTPWIDGTERNSHSDPQYYINLGKYDVALFTNFS